MKNHKDLVIAVAIIIIVIFAGYYFLSQPRAIIEIPQEEIVVLNEEKFTGFGYPDDSVDVDDAIHFNQGEMEPWKLYVDETNGFFFQYPERSASSYIHIGNGTWPPKITMEKGPLVCDESKGYTLWSRASLGTTYCVKEEAQGAAGTIYTDYSFKTLDYTDEVINFEFTISHPTSCDVYDSPQKEACAEDLRLFSLVHFVSQMHSTLVFIDVDHFSKSVDPKLKKFTNDDYNFSLEIPKDWTLERQQPDWANSFSFLSPEYMSLHGFSPGPIVSVGLFVGTETIYERLIKNPEYKDFTNNLKTVTLGGKEFTSYISAAQCDDYNLEISYREKVYTFGTCSYDESNADLEKIAASLVFTK